MKKILLAFDGSLYSESALDYAINLSKEEKDNLIVGVFLQDLSYLYVASDFGMEPQPYQMSYELIEKIKSDESREIEKNVEVFKTNCSKAGIKYQVHLDRGVPVDELINESAFADLILMGYQTYLSNVGQRSEQLLKDLLKDSKCPVFILPEKPQPVKEIIFAYDGSTKAAYAFRQFTHLLKVNFPASKYTLFTVLRDEEETVENEKLIKEYLDLHYQDIKYEKRVGKPHLEIKKYTERSPGGLLVMGAFGRNALSRFFKGSKADTILEAGVNPVFISHT